MKNIGISEFLILSSCVFAFSNSTLAIVAFSLGTLGGFIRYAIQYGEKQQKAKVTENTVENISSIINGLASGMNSGNRGDLH